MRLYRDGHSPAGTLSKGTATGMRPGPVHAVSCNPEPEDLSQRVFRVKVSCVESFTIRVGQKKSCSRGRSSF